MGKAVQRRELGMLVQRTGRPIDMDGPEVPEHYL